MINTPEIHALRGDTVETLFIWEQENVHVKLIDNRYVTPERIEAINSTLLSEKVLMIDDNVMHKGPKGIESPYYFGWQKAIHSIGNTTNPLPKTISFEVSKTANADITISLNNYAHPGGYSGFANKVHDKIYIDIFQVEYLTPNSLKSLVRHELGHAFGIGHTTAPEDLMHERINGYYPYISPCVVLAMKNLYNDIDITTCHK